MNVLIFDEPLGRYVEKDVEFVTETLWDDMMGEWVCVIDHQLYICLTDERGIRRYVDDQIWMYNGHLHVRDKTHNWIEEGF